MRYFVMKCTESEFYSIESSGIIRRKGRWWEDKSEISIDCVLQWKIYVLSSVVLKIDSNDDVLSLS